MASLDFTTMMEQCESQELESPGGVATPAVYSKLLALYLLKNDMTNAKFLWKRIPQPIKVGTPELNDIWRIGQKMWLREFPSVYQLLSQDWSEGVKPIMQAVAETTQSRAFHLVSKAYSSISIEDMSVFLGLPIDEAINAAVSGGWLVDNQNKYILPKGSDIIQDPAIPSEQQLAQLTQFVAYLEN